MEKPLHVFTALSAMHQCQSTESNKWMIAYLYHMIFTKFLIFTVSWASWCLRAWPLSLFGASDFLWGGRWGEGAVDAQMIYTFTPVSSSNWVLSGKCKFWNALLGQFVWDFCLILFAESESVFENKSRSGWFRYKRKWHRKYLGESESGREEEMWVIRGGNRGEDAAIIRR